jgi:hypothetical protein
MNQKKTFWRVDLFLAQTKAVSHLFNLRMETPIFLKQCILFRIAFMDKVQKPGNPACNILMSELQNFQYNVYLTKFKQISIHAMKVYQD